MARMKLITRELEKKLPDIGKSTPKGDPICLVKLFNPCGAGTWWIAEKEKGGDLLYGIAEIFEREIGYFSLGIRSTAMPQEYWRIKVYPPGRA